MALGGKVALIPMMTIDMGSGERKFDIACHQATCYWLYEEAKGTSPTGANYQAGVLGDVTTMRAIAALGQPVTNAAALNRLPSGTVLIFTDNAGTAEHSCVIASNGDIGGYNQTPWFFGGLPNMFSMHPRSAVKWSGTMVKPYQKAPHNLVAVSEAAAVQYAQANF